MNPVPYPPMLQNKGKTGRQVVRMRPIYKNECLKCGYTWFPRQEQRPQACPSCHSRLWDGLKNRTFYGFSKIEVGKEFIYEWYYKLDDSMDTIKNLAIKKAARTYCRRTGKCFHITPKYFGLIIRRII
jgi:DNA-directed RNA polymerase subunit RPC12/RpoP